MNKYRTMHWTVRQGLHEDQLIQLQQATRKIKKVDIKYPVSIKFILEKPRPFDCDNVVVKNWIDSLVKLKFLENDSPPFVESVELVSKKSKLERLTVEICS